MAQLEPYCLVIPGEAEKQFDDDGNERQWSDPIYKSIDWDKQWQEMNAWIDERIQFMASREPGSSLVGCLFRYGVADGYAWYIVTQDEPLTLQFVYGEYQAQDFVIRGLLDEDIEASASALTFFARRAEA